ncbi:sigma-70 family RNA polymerase sigma factor [Amylibacter sp. SFDW26]|uniref:sigma-70 family RNA polymerase sigma factor n=1 Tax=Amylibacter sp. SFDW26 TaxID=2652722 RepID=UPI0012621E02|nr:sigma-70 family RNA polymerase sigma factor [Amylibacter sp. SFDW26]KAB7616033.1 sigma-70 family RNA polymerase sigma factor [Amylibacter sp. SFDW26]
MLTENLHINQVEPLRYKRAYGFVARSKKVRQGGKAVTTQKTEVAEFNQCLVNIATSQDKKAFAVLFAHFAPRIKSFLMKAGATEGTAEECVQETMATVWRKSKQFDPKRASASTWIFTIARNKRIDVIRKRNRPEPDEVLWGPVEEPDAQDIIATAQESELLTKAVSNLPDKQQDLVKRAFYGDLSHKEIAVETGLPLGTIKSRLRLALEKLRHEMKRAEQ